MNRVQTPTEDFERITGIIQVYFDGLHHGDVTTLKSIFHQDAWLKAPGVRRSLEEWLHAVAERPAPAQQSTPYTFKILSIDVVKDQAMVKVQTPLFEINYIDFLGLLKEQGQWLIVNKMYTDINPKKISVE